jgi:hypothetical protein
VAAVGDALDDAAAVEVLNEWSPEESAGEYLTKLKNRLKDVHIGTLIQLAKQYGWTPCFRVLPAIEDATELISKPNVLPAPVIEGVAHRGEKIAIGGPSKAFKTWILSDLAVSVATAGRWLNHFQCTRGKVLHLNFELMSPYFADRLRALTSENLSTLEKDYLHVWNLRGFACDLTALLPKILERISNIEYSLLILDPIYKVLGKLRQENVAGDVADLLNQIETLAVKTNAAVAYGQHYSKGNQARKEAIDRVAGSGVFARDPDTLVNFTELEAESCFRVDLKFRHHLKIEPFGVRWKYPRMIVDTTLDLTKLKTSGRPLEHHAKDLLALIDEPMSATEIVRLAYEELQIPRRRVFELLRDLKRAGLIRQPEKRGFYEPI